MKNKANIARQKPGSFFGEVRVRVRVRVKV